LRACSSWGDCLTCFHYNWFGPSLGIAAGNHGSLGRAGPCVRLRKHKARGGEMTLTSKRDRGGGRYLMHEWIGSIFGGNRGGVGAVRNGRKDTGSTIAWVARGGFGNSCVDSGSKNDA